MNRNIVRIAGLIISAFSVVIIYLTYLQVYKAPYLLNHPRNKRLLLLEKSIVRGRILDSTGSVLAETVEDKGEKRRSYPYGEITGNITGYLSEKYGRSGLESAYNHVLLGLESGWYGDGSWALKRIGAGKRGNDIVLSLDAGLQQLTYRLLGNRRAAVVVMEPATGRVLAMVSRPGFNPERIESDWEKLRQDQKSPLLNRATQGLYPPGSTMKVITAAGILTQKPETADRIFDAPGYVVIEGRRIEDRQARGRLNLAQAMAISSNYVFGVLGLEQGAKNFVNTAHNFGIGRNIPFDLFTENSRIPDPDHMSRLELGETAIGQGRVMVTPLSMALVASAVANGGKIPAPALVDEIRSPEGFGTRVSQPRFLGNAVDNRTAGILRELMVAAVDHGTGSPASIPGIKVAGKTGSAENPHGKTHAWFIGFAPADNPRVAVAVIIENGGSGGAEAAPVAREIMKTVIGQKR